MGVFCALVFCLGIFIQAGLQLPGDIDFSKLWKIMDWSLLVFLPLPYFGLEDLRVFVLAYGLVFSIYVSIVFRKQLTPVSNVKAAFFYMLTLLYIFLIFTSFTGHRFGIPQEGYIILAPLAVLYFIIFGKKPGEKMQLFFYYMHVLAVCVVFAWQFKSGVLSELFFSQSAQYGVLSSFISGMICFMSVPFIISCIAVAIEYEAIVDSFWWNPFAKSESMLLPPEENTSANAKFYVSRYDDSIGMSLGEALLIVLAQCAVFFVFHWLNFSAISAVNITVLLAAYFESKSKPLKAEEYDRETEPVAEVVPVKPRKEYVEDDDFFDPPVGE